MPLAAAPARRARQQGRLPAPPVEFPEPRRARLLLRSRALPHPEALLLRRGQRERNRLRRMAHNNLRPPILQQLTSRPKFRIPLVLPYTPQGRRKTASLFFF